MALFSYLKINSFCEKVPAGYAVSLVIALFSKAVDSWCNDWHYVTGVIKGPEIIQVL